MANLKDVKRQQRKWATARDIAVDQNGYVSNERYNFFVPLSAKFHDALGGAGGGELKDQRHHPAKIRALHSSAVLAINVFQYWDCRGGPVLPAALGFAAELNSVDIERQFPSGLGGTPPTLDLVLTLDDGRLVAIESKFTEWMTRKRPKLDHFREKYLPAGGDFWAKLGLTRCQALAAGIADGRTVFRHLDALQLLKHALGLRNSAPGPFSLLYLYYDHPGMSESAGRHRQELDLFAEHVDAALDFRSLHYQTLFAALSAAAGVDPGYLDYLRARYFTSARQEHLVSRQ
jgi:hypothetical protein